MNKQQITIGLLIFALCTSQAVMAQSKTSNQTPVTTKTPSAQQRVQPDVAPVLGSFSPILLERMAERIGLSDLQRQNIRVLIESHKASVMQLEARRTKNSQSLMLLKPSDKQYDSKVNAASKEAGEIAAQLFKQQALLHKNILATLTAEQLEKVNSIHQNFSGDLPSTMLPMMGRAQSQMMLQHGRFDALYPMNGNRRLMQSQQKYSRHFQDRRSYDSYDRESNESHSRADHRRDESTDDRENSRSEDGRQSHQKSSGQSEHTSSRRHTSATDASSEHRSSDRTTDHDNSQRSSAKSDTKQNSESKGDDESANDSSSRAKEHTHGRSDSRHQSDTEDNCEKSENSDKASTDTSCSSHNEKKHSTTLAGWIADKWRRIF